MTQWYYLIFYIVTLFLSLHGTPKCVTIIPFVGFEHKDILFNPLERDETTKPF